MFSVGLELRLKGQRIIPTNDEGQATEDVDINDLPVDGYRRYETLECLSDVKYRGRVPNAYWEYTDKSLAEYSSTDPNTDVHRVDDIRCKGDKCESSNIGWHSTLGIYRKGRSYYFVLRLGRSDENAKEGFFTCIFGESERVTVKICECYLSHYYLTHWLYTEVERGGAHNT